MLVITASAMWYYARQQHKLEKTKLRLEKYSQIKQGYDTLKTCLNEIIKGTVADTNALKYLITKIDSLFFLFNKTDKMNDYLKEFRNKALIFVKKQPGIEFLVSHNMGTEKNWEKVEEFQSLVDWFKAQNEIIDKKFEKYLRIE